MPIAIPLMLVAGGVAALVVLALSTVDEPPNHPPDLPAGTPGSTLYKRVDAILDELKKASTSSGIPLGVLVGWIAKESGGKLGEVTRLDERGLFQLTPDESKKLGLDHQLLSTDLVYSINAGLLLIGSYMRDVRALGIAPEGSRFFWLMVKLCHSMGTGAVKKIVAAAQAAGATKSWDALEGWAIDHDSEMLSLVKHSPKKWFPFVDAVYTVGAPFGFGDAATAVVGAEFSDIVDPLDCLKK